MKVRVVLAMLGTGLIAYALGAQGRNDARVEKSPHAIALELVFKTQQARIREVDTEDWWHDVKERAWIVKRPFHPGVIDSTHMFDVSYRIGGERAACWFVDTAKGNVQMLEGRGKKLK